MEKINIVVLDGHCLNPGDLSWHSLQDIGELEVFPRTAEDEVVSRAKDAHIVLTNKTMLSADTIHKLMALKYIGVLATGFNVVDIEAAAQRSIPVCNVPSYATDSTAQMVFAHLLNLAFHVAPHAQSVRNGKWSQSQHFCYWDYPLLELSGLKMGIFGFGKIGRATARIAQAMNMPVIVHNRRTPSDLPAGIGIVSRDELFRQSDVISLHCPLTEYTEELINRHTLSLMKPSAFLINTGRGQLLNEIEVARALNTGQIAGAGLDVLAQEPPQSDNPLLSARNCFVTPHIAWASRAARVRLLEIVIDNIKSFLKGNPQNVVNL